MPNPHRDSEPVPIPGSARAPTAAGSLHQPPRVRPRRAAVWVAGWPAAAQSAGEARAVLRFTSPQLAARSRCGSRAGGLPQPRRDAAAPPSGARWTRPRSTRCAAISADGVSGGRVVLRKPRAAQRRRTRGDLRDARPGGVEACCSARLTFSVPRDLGRSCGPASSAPKELTRGYIERLRDIGPKIERRRHGSRRSGPRQARAADREAARRAGPQSAARRAVRSQRPARDARRADDVGRGAVSATQVVRSRRHRRAPLCATQARCLVAKLAMVELAGRLRLRPRGRVVHRAGPDAVEHGVLERRLFERPRRGGRGGLVPFAIGSETSGSILTPAAFCGVTGLRPTYGLVSRHGAMALCWTLDKLGPMCRTADDCGLVLGGDRRRRSVTMRARCSAQFAWSGPPSRAAASRRKLRVAVPKWLHRESAARGARQLRGQRCGARCGRATFERATSSGPICPGGRRSSTIVNAEGAAAFSPLLESGATRRSCAAPPIASAATRGLATFAVDYIQALRARGADAARAGRAVRDVRRRRVADARFGRLSGRQEISATRIRTCAADRPLIPAGNLPGLPRGVRAERFRRRRLCRRRSRSWDRRSRRRDCWGSLQRCRRRRTGIGACRRWAERQRPTVQSSLVPGSASRPIERTTNGLPLSTTSGRCHSSCMSACCISPAPTSSFRSVGSCPLRARYWRMARCRFALHERPLGVLTHLDVRHPGQAYWSSTGSVLRTRAKTPKCHSAKTIAAGKKNLLRSRSSPIARLQNPTILGHSGIRKSSCTSLTEQSLGERRPPKRNAPEHLWPRGVPRLESYGAITASS